MNDLVKFLILGGIMLILAGVCLAVFGKVPGLGRLPGDILIKKGNATFYFPFTSCLLISMILCVLFYLWNQK